MEKDNSGVVGAHKSGELAEKGAKYGARKIEEGYRSNKLKPYRVAAKAEKSAEKANATYLYQKALHDNSQITAYNQFSRYMQKQRIKKQYAKTVKAQGAKSIKNAVENTRKATKKTAEETKKAVAFPLPISATAGRMEKRPISIRIPIWYTITRGLSGMWKRMGRRQN